ncbi:MAG: transketolase [Planctomycetes bacterium]|nr:transketolase [Planctomycetota bacterium]
MPSIAADEVSTLYATAQRLRRGALLATSEAGSGHPTTCLSCAEIVSVLFFREMRWDPSNPAARNVDSFVLSKGHAAPILWVALREAGAIADDPLTLRKAESVLEGHPTPLSPWVKVATGSLGQGLSAAAGMAWARRADGLDARIYCLLGDGETAEGSVWEAAEFIAFNRLDSVCAIVDVNGLGQSGPTMHGHDLEAIARRFEAFGWAAHLVDGHSVPALAGAFERARATGGRPSVVVARTQKGKGVGAIEGVGGWHGKAFKKGPDLEAAIRELGEPAAAMKIQARRTNSAAVQRSLELPGTAAPTDYAIGQEVATREAYGTALVELGRVNPDVVVLDGDVKNSTFAEKFKTAIPDRFIEGYIAEQNMTGVAAGLASEGKIPFVSTFACFLTRAYDQIRMSIYSRPRTMVFCGSHAGVSIGEDGPSQMGLEDLAMFRALIDSTVLYPADAVCAERLVIQAAAIPGIVYIRTTRPKTKVLYSNQETFPVGGSKTLKSSAQDQATLVAAGVTLYEAIEAHERLAREGIAVRVIDAYSVKPIDAKTLRQAARETRILVTIEDHSVHGGLGDAVAGAVGGGAKLETLGVTRIPRSATPKECMDAQGITAPHIAAAVRRLLQ